MKATVEAIKAEIYCQLDQACEQWSPMWWVHAAFDALTQGRMHLIPQRNDRDALYLARFWLTPPKPDRNDPGRWESAESVLLHYFATGDDDQALHDHPWNFQTTILAGEYDEHLPPYAWESVMPPTTTWRRGHAHFTESDWKAMGGPAWNQRIETRRAGETIRRDRMDLHCVGRVAPGTWTLVRTGQRLRDWGFHPPGKPWVPWREFLGVPAKAAAGGGA